MPAGGPRSAVRIRTRKVGEKVRAERGGAVAWVCDPGDWRRCRGKREFSRGSAGLAWCQRLAGRGGSDTVALGEPGAMGTPSTLRLVSGFPLKYRPAAERGLRAGRRGAVDSSGESPDAPGAKTLKLSTFPRKPRESIRSNSNRHTFLGFHNNQTINHHETNRKNPCWHQAFMRIWKDKKSEKDHACRYAGTLITLLGDIATHPPKHPTMTKSEKNKLLTKNTILWITAMVLPGVLHFALASTKFPWPVILPLLLFGAMLASNSMLAKAIGDTTDDSSRK